MPRTRHTFTKPGHVFGAVPLLRRLFGIQKNAVGVNVKDNYDTATRSQLTNAEYHLTYEQMKKIIDAGVTLRDRLILQLLAETGLRRSEVIAVWIEDIRDDERLLLIRRGKGNKSRLVPLTPGFIKNLRQFTFLKSTGPVFANQQNRALSVRQVNRIVARAGLLSGVLNPNPKYRHITPHLFRHSFARLWKDRGGDIEALSKIMGHQSTATTWDLYGTMSLHDIGREYGKVMRSITENKIRFV